MIRDPPLPLLGLVPTTGVPHDNDDTDSIRLPRLTAALGLKTNENTQVGCAALQRVDSEQIGAAGTEEWVPIQC